MAIRFTNSIYQLNHGKNPRGTGFWGFLIRCKDSVLTKKNCPFDHYQQDYSDLCLIWSTGVMTLTEAKKEVGDWLKANGFSGIVAVAD